MDTATLIKLLNVAALMAIKLAMGMQGKFGAVMGSTRPLRRLVLCLFANYVMVPAVTVGLLYLFQANPMVWVSFLVLARPTLPSWPGMADLPVSRARS